MLNKNFNNLIFFDKFGQNINVTEIKNYQIEIVDESGKDFDIEIFTNFDGKVIDYKILNGGKNYTNPTIYIYSKLDTIRFLVIEPNDIVLGPNGEIISINNLIGSEDLVFPFKSFITNIPFERTSIGINEVGTIHILEKVWNGNNLDYSLPMFEYYGPFEYKSLQLVDNKLNIEVEKCIISGVANTGDNFIQYSTLSTTNIKVGDIITGKGIDNYFYILEIDTILKRIYVSGIFQKTFIGNWESYTYYGIKEDTYLVFNDSSEIFNKYKVLQVRDNIIQIDWGKNFVPNFTLKEFFVVPQFEIEIVGENFYFFDINLLDDFPKISTFNKKIINLLNNSIPPATYYNNELREENNIEKKSFQINFLFNSPKEGIFEGILRIKHATFVWSEEILLQCGLYAEAEDSDERLNSILELRGTPLTEREYKIIKSSNVLEHNTNFQLLNKKRREFILQWNEIFNHLGAYKALFNIIKFLEWNELKIKEYFIKISEEYNYLYKSVEISNDKKIFSDISKNWKKTHKFGLVYPYLEIIPNEYTEQELPKIKRNFKFTLEELFIKLFELKKYLKENFLPLNCQIVDISIEGITFIRNDFLNFNVKNESKKIFVGRKLDISYPKKVEIDYVDTPLLPEFTLLNTEKIYNLDGKFILKDIKIIQRGTTKKIPKLLLDTNETQKWHILTIRGKVGNYNLSVPTGEGFLIGDRIIFGNGVFENPIIGIVSGVNLTNQITQIEIIEGANQGYFYTSIPSIFNIKYCQRYNNFTNRWETFVPNSLPYINSIDLDFELDTIILIKNIKLENTNWNFLDILGAQIELVLESDDKKHIGQYSNFINYSIDESSEQKIGAKINLQANFELLWKDLHLEKWGKETEIKSALLKPWYVSYPLSGTGQLLAVEILEPGQNYSYAPLVLILGDGSGAQCELELRNGKLLIQNFVSNSVSSGAGTNDIIGFLPGTFNSTGLNKVTIGKIVKGPGIPDGTIIAAINYFTQEIILQTYDGNPVTTTFSAGDTLEIHEGVNILNSGQNYSDIKLETLYLSQDNFTWDTIQFWEDYEIQWIIKLEESRQNKVFEAKSPVLPIRNLINWQFIVPYIGKYTIELRVWDLYGNISNKIIKNAIEVITKPIIISYVSKWTTEELFSWESKEFSWKNFCGNFITGPQLSINKISEVLVPFQTFNFELETKKLTYDDIKIINVYQEDYFEGDILDYDKTSNQIYLPLEPNNRNQTLITTYKSLENIYLINNNQIYLIEATNINFTSSNKIITLASPLPEFIEKTIKKWKVFREISNHILIENTNNLEKDSWIELYPQMSKEHFIVKGIKTPQPNIDTYVDINLKSIEGNNSKIKEGELGIFYRKRDWNIGNGELVFGANWNFEVNQYNKKEIILYIKDTYNLLSEIVPGFQEIVICVSNIGYGNPTRKIKGVIKSAYKFSGNTGPYTLFGSEPYVLHIELYEFNNNIELFNQINNLFINSGYIWLEYEYDIFITKIRYSELISSTIQRLYPEFNLFEPSENFIYWTFLPTQELNNSNWFYKNYISDNQSYSFKILDIKNHNGNLLLLLDNPGSTLSQIDTKFLLKNTKFNLQNLECLNTFNNVDNEIEIYKNEKLKKFWTDIWQPSLLEYSLKLTFDTTKSSLKLNFNHYEKNLVFSETNFASKITEFLYYVNNQYDFINWFEWKLKNKYDIQKIEIDTTNSIQNIILYAGPSFVPMINDSIFIKEINQYFTISGITTIGPGVYDLLLDKPIELKSFYADIKQTTNTLQNIKFLDKFSVNKFKFISNNNFPGYPKIVNVFSVNNDSKILQIILNTNSTNTLIEYNSEVFLHYVFETNEFEYISILDSVVNTFWIEINSKDNSIQTAGLWKIDNGFLNNDSIIGTELFNLDISNYKKWFYQNFLYANEGSDGIDTIYCYYDIINLFNNKLNTQYYANNIINILPNYENYFLPAEYQLEGNEEAQYQYKILPYLVKNYAYSFDSLKWTINNGYVLPGVRYLITATSSQMVGKLKYVWKIYYEESLFAELQTKNLYFSFNKEGNWKIICIIEDNLGNISEFISKIICTNKNNLFNIYSNIENIDSGLNISEGRPFDIEYSYEYDTED